MKSGGYRNRRKSQRIPVKKFAEFFFATDVVRAMTIDASREGLKIEIREPLEVELRLISDEKVYNRRARLCWMKKNKDGSSALGLEYLFDSE